MARHLTEGVSHLACPYFMPTHKAENIAWIHPARLPLGAGWSGFCTAPGFENQVPSDGQVRESCNLGYAGTCPRRPQASPWDSIRFGVSRESNQRLELRYVCEKDHQPAAHGILEYDVAAGRWSAAHTDARIQKMAECFVEAYLLRKNPPAISLDSPS